MELNSRRQQRWITARIALGALLVPSTAVLAACETGASTPITSPSSVELGGTPSPFTIAPNVTSSMPTTAAASLLPPKIAVTGTLNYDGLTANNTCLGGGPRPCFAPIRKTPHFASQGTDPTADYLNGGTFDTNGRYTAVAWPYEAGDGRPADQLTIVCRVAGDNVYGADKSKSSNVWDAVEVPAEHSRSGAATVGYMPERWVRLPAGIVIEECDAASNPAHAPVITTPTQN